MTGRCSTFAVASLMLLLLLVPSAHAFSVEKENPGPNHAQIELPTSIYPIEGVGHHQENPNLNSPNTCLLYTSPSPRDVEESRMPSSA